MGIVSWIFKKLTYGEKQIMAKLEEITSQLDELKAFVMEVDAAVEQLHDQIAALPVGGVSDAAAAVISGKITEIREAVAKVATDDSEPEPNL